MIEMLVVLAILGLIAAVAFPRLRSDRPESPKMFAQKIFAMAQTARLSAIRSNQSRSLIISLGDRTIRSDVKNQTVAITNQMNFGVTYGQRGEAMISDARITFFPSGGSTGGAMTFSRGNKEDVAKVSINWLTGAVSLIEDVSKP